MIGAWQRSGVGAEEPFALSAACREEFGGDAHRLGRFRLAPVSTDLTTLAPPCVPEPLFGAMTDILTFLLVQVPGHHGIDSLRRAGDRAVVAPITATWRRPPALAAAKFSASGGWIQFVEVRDGRALVRWSPGKADLSLLRSSNQPSSRVLLAGTEDLELELELDASTGDLVGGRSLKDNLALSLLVNFPEPDLPAVGAPRPAGGVPIALRRSLVLTPLFTPAR